MTRRYQSFSPPLEVKTYGEALVTFVSLVAGIALLIVAGVALALYFVAPAHARWRSEYANAAPVLRDWFESRELTAAARARFGFASCCAHADVVKTQFRVGGVGQDQWWWLNQSDWQRVPDDIIPWDEHSPTGLPVLFVSGGHPVCFFPPGSGQ
jgi:hypothetical protein